MFGINIGALIIIAVAVITPSIGWWQSHIRLDVCTANFDAFKANTQLEGERSEKEKTRRETALAKAAVNIQGDLNETRVNRDKRYAEFERMLAASQTTNPGSGGTSGTAETPSRLNCPDGSAELNSRMAGFEAEVVRKLLKSRDEALTRNAACKAYIEQITDIMTNKPEN